MVTPMVIKLKVFCQFPPQFPGAVEFVDIYAFILDASPKPLHEDVIETPATVVHADKYVGIYEYLSIFRACIV